MANCTSVSALAPPSIEPLCSETFAKPRIENMLAEINFNPLHILLPPICCGLWVRRGSSGIVVWLPPRSSTIPPPATPRYRTNSKRQRNLMRIGRRTRTTIMLSSAGTETLSGCAHFHRSQFLNGGGKTSTSLTSCVAARWQNLRFIPFGKRGSLSSGCADK